MSARIERLRAEIRSDREAIAGRLEDLRSLALGPDAGSGDLAQAAWALHHAYSGIEAILERTMRAIEGDLPEGPDYHRAILESAKLDLKGIRPPLLSPDTVRDLHELRAFRHFVRHAYAVELDGARMAELRDCALQILPVLEREFESLDEWLSEISGTLAEDAS